MNIYLEVKIIDSLIIDVRGNSGGYLTTVSNMLELFVDRGKILYQMQTNEGTTEEQTEEAEEQSNDTQEFEGTIDVTGHWEDSSVVFELDTNLPDEAELMFTVSKGDYNTDDYFTAQGKKTVNEGHITSDGFSSSGEPLSGEYDLCVSMSLPRLQTDNVRNAIGENGEYMTGSLVEESEITGDKTINALFSVSIRMLFHPFPQLPSKLLIPGLSQQCEHVALIAVHPGLIKRIHTQNITAHSAGKFKKVE